MTCLFTMSQFPCLLHGIAKGGDNLPHRVVVGILVLVYVKEMDAGLTGTASQNVAGQGQHSQLLPRILNLFCE